MQGFEGQDGNCLVSPHMFFLPCHSDITHQHGSCMYESTMMEMGTQLFSGGIISESKRVCSGIHFRPLCKGYHIPEPLLRLLACHLLPDVNCHRDGVTIKADIVL